MKNSYYPLFVTIIACLALPTACTCTKEADDQGTTDKLTMPSYRKALAHHQSGQHDSALHFYRESLHYSRNLQHKEYEIRSLIGMSSVIRTVDPSAALQHLNDALSIADSMQHGALKADILWAIAETHKREENHREALAALELHSQVLDSLHQANTEREIARLKTEERLRLERWVATIIIGGVLTIALLLVIGLRRLNKLNRRLAQNDKVKNMLFAVIGHDLRGPAGSLKTALDTLADMEWNGTVKELVDMFRRQVAALADTIDNLMGWARMQLSGIALQPEQFDVIPVLETVISLLSGQAKEKNISIQTAFGDGARIIMDKEHFSIIMRNLISNAIKFSFPGGNVSVRMEVARTLLRLAVEDNGVGMDAEARTKLEQHTLSSTFGTAGEKGLGLGFQITSQLVAANKGTITVDSKETVGTVINVVFPMGV